MAAATGRLENEGDAWRAFCVIQVHERLVPGPLCEVRARFEWSELRIFDLNAPGEKPGVLLGTNGWNPRMA